MKTPKNQNKKMESISNNKKIRIKSENYIKLPKQTKERKKRERNET